MKKAITISAILVIFIAIFVARYGNFKFAFPLKKEEEPAFEMHINESINKELSSKANYDFGKDEIFMPEQCHIVHTETLQRHGARHVNKLNKIEKILTYFEELKEQNILKDDRLIEWSRDLLENERNNTGSICKTGEIEIRDIAKRLRERIHFDEDPSGSIIVDNTFKGRTQQTRDVFLNSLLPSSYAKEQIQQQEFLTCEDAVAANETGFASYAPLRYFSICPNYHAFKKDEGVNQMINESFKYNPEIESVHGKNKVWTELFNSTKKVSDDEKEDIMKKLYFICQYEASCYNNYNRTCQLLAKEPAIFNQLGYDDDARLFLLKGPGAEVTIKMACPLGRDMIGGLARYVYTAMEEGEAKQAFFSKYDPYFDLSKPDHSRLHLRFGHAESLLPLYNLFIMKPPRRVENRINFSGQVYVPMSANFQLDLVECEGEYYVRLLANEVPVRLDLVGAYDTTLFKVNDLFDQWIGILESNELNICSYNDFVNLCGEPTCN